MVKKRGFTLLELILSMVIFSWILVMFASMVSFNYRFATMSFRTDDLIQEYISNNTYLYNRVINSEDINLISGGKAELTFKVPTETVGVYDTVVETIEIKNKKLYYEAEVLYDLLPGSFMQQSEDLFIIKLEIDNPLEQKVEIAVPYKFN